jgi:hypothetical protein
MKFIVNALVHEPPFNSLVFFRMRNGAVLLLKMLGDTATFYLHEKCNFQSAAIIDYVPQVFSLVSLQDTAEI